MTQVWGEVRAAGAGYDLSFERAYATSVDDVWSAVTEPDRLARWMAPYGGELRLGGTWQALNDDGTVFSWGTVTECEPPHRYVTTWEYEGERPSEVVVTVTEHPEGARLVLAHTGLVDIGYGAGWQAYLEQLDDALGLAAASERDPGRRVDVAWEDRYRELSAPWRERIEAARR
ncbi:MAG TPA: SRPBCC family protein [Actinotalea sp.]|nr:SRPBCC family protein [Actinotalea sp.]